VAAGTALGIKSGTKIGPSAPALSHDPTLLPSMASQMRMPVSVHNQEQIARAERQLGRSPIASPPHWRR
jgi:chemotaxis protein MotB